MMWYEKFALQSEKVTLYIDDTSIRLLVSQGKRVKKWAELKLESGLVKNSLVTQEGEVAARIRLLLESQKVNTKKVTIGFSGLHSLTRPAILPQLPKAMIPEAVAREARRVLPVPLDQIYISWQNLPCTKEKIHVFIAAIPRKNADSLVHTLHKAGLEPNRMYIKPMVLTKMLPDKTAIMVDIQSDEFDIVILSDGVPQPIRTVIFPYEESSWNRKLEMIASELNRTIKFFDTNNPEKPIDESAPIYVSGEITDKPELCQELSENAGRPVQLLSTELKGPEQIDAGRFMVNIAMAVKKGSSSGECMCSIANLNLLPVPYLPKPISLTKVIGIPGGVAVAGLVLPMVMMIQSTSSNISAVQNELDMVNQLTNQKTAQRLELMRSVNDLRDQVNGAMIIKDNLDTALNKVFTQQEITNGDLDIAVSRLSSTITLESISATNGTLTISGSAPNEEDIYYYAQVILQYARALDISHRFTETTVSAIKTNDPTNNIDEESEDTGNIILEDPADDQFENKIDFTLTFERNIK